MESHVADDEAERIKAMFQANDEHWKETQERMSQFVLWRPIRLAYDLMISSTTTSNTAQLPSIPIVEVRLNAHFSHPHTPSPSNQSPCPQATYVTVALNLVRGQHCYVSLESQSRILGHWIQDCPTNDDRDFDNRPRIKRTTGIPRSFLKPVEAPEGAQGVMVTPEGGFVVAQPDV